MYPESLHLMLNLEHFTKFFKNSFWPFECLSPRVRLECNPEIPIAPGD